MSAIFIKGLHIISAGLWIGTAATLPFWGNRVNRADNLPMVLGIADTVLVLKMIFIMGGLVGTLVTGVYLTEVQHLGYFDFSSPDAWLAYSQLVFLLIAVNSCVILYLMLRGRRGSRSLYRFIPPIGYTNIALILLLFVQMSVKPATPDQVAYLGVPMALILLANGVWWLQFYSRLRALRLLTPEQYAKRYFGLLADEDMTNFFRLFRDDAEFHDPFATHPVVGLKNIEKFFQQLGDQFEDIRIVPDKVLGSDDRILSVWTARGTTKNGEPIRPFSGANVMHLVKGKIKRIDIFFDPRLLPRVVRVDPSSF